MRWGAASSVTADLGSRLPVPPFDAAYSYDYHNSPQVAVTLKTFYYNVTNILSSGRGKRPAMLSANDGRYPGDRTLRFRKIFNISLHRSGTQSVHDLLVRSGVSSIHWPGGVIKGVSYENQVRGHEHDVEHVTAALAPLMEMVTAVSDVPIAVLYEQLEYAYPNSGFILTYRNPFDWVLSVRNHIGDRDLNVFEKVQYWRYLLGTVNKDGS